MISRTRLSILIFVAAVIWGILLILEGITLQPQFFQPFSTVIGVLVIILTAFENWLWRLPIFYPWLVSVPNLQGTWKGKVVSNWINPKTGQQIDPIEAYLVIRQTFSIMKIRLFTAESSSESLTASIIREQDGSTIITATYRNTPRMLLRGQSPIHHLADILKVVGEPPQRLEGQYWTDRDSKGELSFNIRNKEIHHSYSDASKATYRKKS